MEIITNIIKYGCAETFAKYNPDLPVAVNAIVGLLCLLLCIVSAYLLGSINFAIIISKFRGDDIRNHGSKNAGTTNMLRTYGKKAAVVTLLGDFLKGTVAVLIGLVLAGAMGQYLSALFVVLGHVFPVFYKFQGGKGIATAAGAILGTAPIVLLILVAVFVGIVALTKYVSLASVMVALLYPIILDRFYKITGVPAGIYMIFVMILSGVVVWKHWPNIKRLLNNTESKISFKKKSAVEETKEEENRGEDE